MKLSVVATLYQSASHIDEFYQRVTQAARGLVGDSYEIILVNDGSPDNSLELAVRLSEQDDHVVVVDLSRNFGHHKAMMTGLDHSQGEHVFLIDSDLEEEPECLGHFAEQMTREGCDVIYGQQESRKGGRFERISGQWFYGLFKLLTGFALPRNVVTARLMTRRYVDALLRHQEREVFMAGLWHITGFDQRGQILNKLSTSQTTYTFRRKMSLLVNSVTSFSNTPLVSIFYIGLAISLLSTLYISYLVINWMFLAKPLSGWTSVMASIWLLGGMIISFIGIVGIYLSKIFAETKQRPYTIVRQIYAKRPK
ncbi:MULTISPECIES: glycosyltransferase family 2 protein [unclassified Pseudomonas]|uniref:glycosyltransferase family 2 protein n=1 Tax=unclassified Pseudomonas TaxID=196821 RepID=UPI000FBDFAFC|nr:MULTISPECIES: glycosyltransferase family 2 protein [unclassified Pseudomonas]MCE5982937.1 glycosyltransferase family 2 protein [Pseudomonas sp. LF19]SPO69305.1 putative glycosyltransferases [Pseudomonas sp. JV241A]